MRLPSSTVPVVALAVLATGIIAGCGDDDAAPPAARSASSPPSAAGPTGAAPGSSTELPTRPVKPAPSADNVAPPLGVECGQARGPEGSLTVQAISPADLDCGVVMAVATEFGPQISAGKPVTIDGWHCGPSTDPQYLARCDRGADSFGFIPR